MKVRGLGRERGEIEDELNWKKTRRRRKRKMLKAPITPMDALLVETMPEGPGWQYEPKWNGFRCLVFRGVSPIPIHE